MNWRSTILLSLAVIAGLVLAQYAMRPTVIELGPQVPTTQTTGVVKSLNAALLLSRSPLQQATVTLADGSLVEASVLPGCVVHSGDSVRVHVFAPSGVAEHTFVVVGPE